MFDNNNKRIISSLLIELTNMYNVYMCELDRVMDLYGIEYVVKYKDLIYFTSLINDTLDVIEDITPDDLDYANTFLDMYEEDITEKESLEGKTISGVKIAGIQSFDKE